MLAEDGKQEIYLEWPNSKTDFLYVHCMYNFT